MAAAAAAVPRSGALLLFSSIRTTITLPNRTRTAISSAVGPTLSAICSTKRNALLPLPNLSSSSSRRATATRFCSSSSTQLPTSKQTSGDAAEENTENAPPPRPPPSDPIEEAADALDIRVGRILKAWRHPEADSLYVEEVDVGEAEPRTICSGLVSYIPLDHLQVSHCISISLGGKKFSNGTYYRTKLLGAKLIGQGPITFGTLVPVMKLYDKNASLTGLVMSESGLPICELKDINVVVLANLKPRNMRGIKSNGMLMAASDASHETVELLKPPEGSTPGERIWFGSEEEKGQQQDAATPNQVQKKKIWESVQPHLKTTDECVAVLGERPMRTSAGVVACTTLKNANIS